MDADATKSGRSRVASEPSIRSPKSQSAKPRRRSSYLAMRSLSKSRKLERVPIDLYSHPAVVEYVAVHPRHAFRTFGNYLLLQTLGEGEFGKVKLGVHIHSGEEVAIKIVRRGDIGSSAKMPGVEHEIQMLRALRHPNIVALHDVVQTKDRIGIVLEYASGGELFDRIIAAEYLDEVEACKLFSQLISGVSYMHKKNIVHRDLKLDNLLLDLGHNVLITDFGFAKRSDHLLRTSCGSPCYAAPELMTSDSYNGPAADVWSCGIILFGMLAGYLPYHDDPDNPEGQDINLLYKYILNSPIPFPDYFSEDIRDLLSLMLVPDPNCRAGLEEVMNHRWLAIWAYSFKRSVAEMEQEALKRLEERRKTRQKRLKPVLAGANLSRTGQNSSSLDRDETSSSHHTVVTASIPVEEAPLILSAADDSSASTALEAMEEALLSGNILEVFKSTENAQASSVYDRSLVAIHDQVEPNSGHSERGHHDDREENDVPIVGEQIASSHEEHTHVLSNDRRLGSIASDPVAASHVPEEGPVQSSIITTSSISTISSGSPPAACLENNNAELGKKDGANPEAAPQSMSVRRNTLTLMRQKLLPKTRNRAKSSASSFSVNEESNKAKKIPFVTVTSAAEESPSSDTSRTDVKTSLGSPAKKVVKGISEWLDYTAFKLHGQRAPSPEEGSKQ